MTEGIFDMSNVRIFKEIEKKKWGGGVFILCYVFGQRSSVKNLCYFKISVVMLLGAKTLVRTKVHGDQMLHI